MLRQALQFIDMVIEAGERQPKTPENLKKLEDMKAQKAELMEKIDVIANREIFRQTFGPTEFKLRKGKIAKATTGSTGYDLFAAIEHPLQVSADTVTAIPTGVFTTMTPNLAAMIEPKSGLALKHGVQVLGGTIDSDYPDEWKVLLTSKVPFRVDPGVKVAQFRIVLNLPSFVVAEEGATFEAPQVKREGGFGSTGEK